MDLKSLSAEFPKQSVHWRVQGKPFKGRNGGYAAKALAYIDARDVMDRLDEVCGPENWQAEYSETPSGRVLCRIGINVMGNRAVARDDGGFDVCERWVWKSDGAGSTQVEGEKGGISDALKRAAVAWGIGRYLYRLDSPWVACDVTVKGDHAYWKAWSEDPWSKVKVVGYQQPEQPKAEEPAPRDPVKIADSLISNVKKAATLERLNTLQGNAQFDEAWQWLAENHEEHSARVRKAVDERKADLTAEQVTA